LNSLNFMVSFSLNSPFVVKESYSSCWMETGWPSAKF
jgi:hypothetical protein